MLTGQAKKDYQHKYMKGYMQRYRTNGVKTSESVKTQDVLRPVKTQDVFCEPIILDEFDSAKVNDSVRPHGCKGCASLIYKKGSGLSCPRGEWSTSVTSVFQSHINPDGDCNEPT